MTIRAIRTRFSPSPTGLLHLGNARAALFSALFAAKNQGIFLLRIEDTDQTRSGENFSDQLQSDLQWFGCHWQEGPFYQSKRQEIYAEYYEKLIKNGRIYPCFCSDQELALHRKLQLSRGQAPRYAGTCSALSAEETAKRVADGKKPALRFRVELNTMVTFTDLIKGVQHFNTNEIGDFIVRRADETAPFLFCNAIDDSLMGVTHVLRGEDHLSNTPRQFMILSALGLRVPEYGHLPLITGDDGTLLSKRHGSFSLHDFHQQGYLPVAIMNYLSRLSHYYEGDHQQKLMTFDELAVNFHIERISRSAARFDMNQLLHWQKEAVLKLSLSETATWLGDKIIQSIPSSKKELFCDIIRKNSLLPEEAQKWVGILFADAISWELDQEKIAILRTAGRDFFLAAQENTKKYGTALKETLDALKISQHVSGKALFMPIRLALTGELHGPELIHIAELLGEEGVLERFQHAMEFI